MAALTDDQARALECVAQGLSVLITGSAGTGKSFLIDRIREDMAARGKAFRVVAPTGVAAFNVRGQTIHRFLGIRPAITTLQEYARAPRRRSPPVPWRELSAVVIDEVSMVHPQLFELLDGVARMHRRATSRPFGGLQMILVGDFYQLAPVKRRDEGPDAPKYVFQTEAWRRLAPTVVELRVVVRQAEDEFAAALDDLRVGRLTDRSREMIRRCSANRVREGEHYVRLFALNVQKNLANDAELAKLEGEEREYLARDFGGAAAAALLKDCRAEARIVLKVGAPVMLLWNLPGLCNGSVGTVARFEGELPVVRFAAGPELAIARQTWSIEETDGRGAVRTLASRTQIPLAIAYSLSIHKSQGLTLDRLVVDCAGVFTTGQLYVALSRASTSAGLVVRNFDESRLMTDDEVAAFYAASRDPRHASA